jgi:hypothetical protein
VEATAPVTVRALEPVFVLDDDPDDLPDDPDDLPDDPDDPDEEPDPLTTACWEWTEVPALIDPVVDVW